MMAKFREIILRPLSEADMECLRQWRNDRGYTRFLSAMPYITHEMQSAWYAGYLTDESIYTFAVDQAEAPGDCIGSVSLYNFRAGICEFGKIMICPELSGRGFGGAAERLAMHIGFQKFGLSRIDTNIHKKNIAALKKAEKDGFSMQKDTCSCCGDDYHHLIADKSEFYVSHPGYKTVEIDVFK